MAETELDISSNSASKDNQLFSAPETLNEWGFRPSLCTYRLNRRASWWWWYERWHCPPDTGSKIRALAVSKQTQNLCITFVQRRPNVLDARQTLYTFYNNVLSSLGWGRVRYLSVTEVPHNIESLGLSGEGSSAVKTAVTEYNYSPTTVTDSPALKQSNHDAHIGIMLGQHQQSWPNID